MTFQYGYRNGMKASAIGEAKRERAKTEAKLAVQFEWLLLLHHCEFWHNEVAQRSQPGWPDYTVFGEKWHAWVELKARSSVTGRAGKVSVEQLRYKDTIERGGGEWITFLLPDEWDAVDGWLNSKTGKDIWGFGGSVVTR